MRTWMRSKVTLLFIVCAVLLAVPVAAALAQDTGTPAAPTIQSDKADYAPGELVTLTGSGWQAGESVRIVVNDDQGQTWSRTQDVTADASGNISDSFNLPNWFVAEYSVTATGAQSGTATTSFTDADVNYDPTRYPSTGWQSVTAGSDHSFDLKATKGGGGADPVVTGFTRENEGGGSPTCGAAPGGATAGAIQANWLSTTKTFPQTISGTTAATATTFPFKIAPPSGTAAGYYKGVITFTASTGGRGLGTVVCVEVKSAAVAPNAPTLNLAAASDSGDSNSDKKTNDDTPTFEGTAKAGSTVNVYDGAVAATNLLGSATANATNGAWSFEVPAAKALSEGTHTISATATDSGGTSTATTLSGLLIDKTAPAANCASASADWSATDATIACAPTDTGGSGLSTATATLTPSSFNLVTSVAAGNETNNASTNSRDIYDVAGNKATAAPIGNNKVDKKAPNTAAAAGTYTEGSWTNQNVTVTLTPTDNGSGVKSTEYSTNGGQSFQAYPASGISLNTDGEHTILYRSTDNVDNQEQPNKSFTVKIDKTAPEFNCDPASSPTGWQADNFTFNCTASDSGGSGLTSGSPATFQLSTTVAAGSETDSASTGSQPLSDVAGNSVTAGPFTGIKVDRKAPELASNCPAGGPYQLGSGTKTVGPIGYTENGSGLDSTNSALSGQVDTSTVGEKSVTFTAKDNVGNVATPKTCKYNVNYVFSGFLQPINMTAHQTGTDVSTFKAGSTVPVKFKLTDANGNVVQPASAPVWVTPLKGSATNQAVDEDLYSLAATTGGTYRYDATAQQWIYNWSTKGASSGCYYRIGVTLDDGKTYYQNISLR